METTTNYKSCVGFGLVFLLLQEETLLYKYQFHKPFYVIAKNTKHLSFCWKLEWLPLEFPILLAFSSFVFFFHIHAMLVFLVLFILIPYISLEISYLRLKIWSLKILFLHLPGFPTVKPSSCNRKILQWLSNDRKTLYLRFLGFTNLLQECNNKMFQCLTNDQLPR